MHAGMKGALIPAGLLTPTKRTPIGALLSMPCMCAAPSFTLQEQEAMAAAAQKELQVQQGGSLA